MTFLVSIAAVVVLILGYFIRHILGGMLGLYRVVPVNEAHIRVLQNTKSVFSSRVGKSAYWVVPFITKLHKLPLCNLAIPVNDIKLNDRDMAKFVCDIMCFVNINNIDLAVERLILTNTEVAMGFDFVKLSEDLRAIMESVGRTVTTKQTILDIYMNRSMLDQAITKEVEVVFPKWGIQLVDLELKDIKDAVGSTIIQDIERKVAAEIRRDADIRVATTTKEAELVKAEAEEIYRKRQIVRDQQIGIAEQEKNQQIAERIKLSVEAEGHSSEITQVGKAEADVIRIKKEADAAGTLKLAEALKQFNEVAINVKILDIHRDVMLAKFHALSQAIQQADIKWIMSGANAQKFFGLNLDAEGGANIQQFFQESGLDLDRLKTLLKEKK